MLGYPQFEVGHGTQDRENKEGEVDKDNYHLQITELTQNCVYF